MGSVRSSFFLYFLFFFFCFFLFECSVASFEAKLKAFGAIVRVEDTRGRHRTVASRLDTEHLSTARCLALIVDWDRGEIHNRGESVKVTHSSLPHLSINKNLEKKSTKKNTNTKTHLSSPHIPPITDSIASPHSKQNFIIFYISKKKKKIYILRPYEEKVKIEIYHLEHRLFRRRVLPA